MIRAALGSGRYLLVLFRMFQDVLEFPLRHFPSFVKMAMPVHIVLHVLIAHMCWFALAFLTPVSRYFKVLCEYESRKICPS